MRLHGASRPPGVVCGSVRDDPPLHTTEHSKAVGPADPPSAAETAAWYASFKLAEVWNHILISLHHRCPIVCYLFLRKLEIGLPGNGFRKWLNIPASAVKKADKESQRNRDECVAAHRGETRSGSSQSMMANAGPLAMVVLLVTTQCAHHRWAWNHIVICLHHRCIIRCCCVLRKLGIGLPGNGFRK